MTLFYNTDGTPSEETLRIIRYIAHHYPVNKTDCNEPHYCMN